MTTAERMYASFMAITTPPNQAITPFAELDGPRMATWEIRAAAFESRELRGLPLTPRLYRAIWANVYVTEWSQVNAHTRLIWRLIAEQFTALDREVSAA